MNLVWRLLFGTVGAGMLLYFAWVTLPRLVTETDISLGQVTGGEMIEAKISIKNSGLFPLRISNIQTSCECSVPQISTLVLSSTGEGTVPVYVRAPRSSKPFSTQVAFETNDPFNRKVLVNLKGIVDNCYDFPAIVSFGEVTKPDSHRHFLDIRVVRSFELPVPYPIEIECSGNAFNIQITEEKENLFVIRVSLAEKAPSGIITEYIRGRDAEGKKFTISVSMINRHEIYAEPSELILGKIGTDSEERHVLEIGGSKRLQSPVVSVSPSIMQEMVEVMSVGPRVVELKIKGRLNKGRFSGEINIFDSENPEVDLVVPVHIAVH